MARNRSSMQALAQKLDTSHASATLSTLWLSFGETFAAMAEQQQWFAGQSAYENLWDFRSHPTLEAYAGHLGKARELTKRDR